jgi:hypothetical protein
MGPRRPADDPMVEARSPARFLHQQRRRMSAAATLLIAEAAIFALAGAVWWPLALVSIVPIVVLGRATLLGGHLDPVTLRRGIEGEERVAELLGELETDGYCTLHDLDLGRGNADHVVVGPTGVFVIETKDWGGRFYSRRGRLMFNQRSADEVVAQVTAAALAIRGRLDEAGIDVWVQAVIASTRARVWASPLRLGHVTAVQADHLAGFVRGRRPVLDAGLVEKAADAIAGGR